MTPEDAYKGRIKIGDTARCLSTGETFVVRDIVQTSVDGSRMVVFKSETDYIDILDTERL